MVKSFENRMTFSHPLHQSYPLPLSTDLALAGLVIVDLGDVRRSEHLAVHEEGQQPLHLHRLAEHGAVLLQQVPVRLVHRPGDLHTRREAVNDAGWTQL